jgi:DNA replication protein DnaC
MNTTDTTITKTCDRCSIEFQTEPCIINGTDYSSTTCDSCETIAQVERATAAAEARRIADSERLDRNLTKLRQELSEATPSLFRGTDRNHPAFNRDRLAAIGKFQPTPEKPWLGLIGTPGKCKSRIAHLLAVEYLESITTASKVPSSIFVAGYQITAAVAKLHDYRDGGAYACDARDSLDQLHRVDLLLIDDIGKGGMAQALATEMLAVIDSRYSRQLPTIWTSNSRPEEIAAGMRGDFAEDMRGPFAGRLVESSKIFQFK